MCYYCGRHGPDGHVDHLIPLSRGGTDDLENLVWSCEPCNLGKGAKTPGEWIQEHEEDESEKMDTAKTDLDQVDDPSLPCTDRIQLLTNAGASKRQTALRVYGYSGSDAYAKVNAVLNRSMAILDVNDTPRVIKTTLTAEQITKVFQMLDDDASKSEIAQFLYGSKTGACRKRVSDILNAKIIFEMSDAGKSDTEISAAVWGSKSGYDLKRVHNVLDFDAEAREEHLL